MPNARLDAESLKRGTELFLQKLEELIEENPEVGDIHGAFELYALQKYSLGNSADNHRVGGKGDLGIDFYSQASHVYRIGQCKIPPSDWLEANPAGTREFGPQALSDARDAFRYVSGGSNIQPNEAVKHLFALVERDRRDPDFSVHLLVIVYGRLKQRAEEEFHELREQFRTRGVELQLVEIDELVEEFLVGQNHTNEQIKFDLRIRKNELIRAQRYCYFLANAGDLYAAFLKFGWRLFDLNLRYEVRNSPINGEIVRSLSFHKSRKEFHHYNNGLIIVAKSHSFVDSDSKIRLTEAQIVNGLQTVKSIYNAVVSKGATSEELESECVVQVKVISTDAQEFVSKIVRSTNNQNPMAPRNLRSNTSDQKVLRKAFNLLDPRWFFQVKDGEWKSLTGEGGRFFEQVVGAKPRDFKPEPTKQFGRVLDNQDAAKAWLAFIGFADYAADRVTYFFSEDRIYDLAFRSRPNLQYWRDFSVTNDWDTSREKKLELVQGTAEQYLLAYFIWKYVNAFVPTPLQYRRLGLDEGVRSGKIQKASQVYTSPAKDQDSFLSENETYQVWRLMANMKEVLCELVSQILARRYGELDAVACKRILQSFEAREFATTAYVDDLAQRSAHAAELEESEVFGRIMRLLHYVCQQFWEDKKQQLLAISRLRTLLLRRDVAASLKQMIWQTNDRIRLDRPWKPEGKTFVASLPALNQ